MSSPSTDRVSSSPATPRRLGAALLGLALAVATASAGMTRVARADDQPEESTAQAQALYREGQNYYETANYKKAIEKWTEAYGLMDWGPATAEAKTSLLYNLAAAHEKEFGISAKVQNLRTAKVLLQSFAERIPTIYGETPEAKSELDRVEHRIAEIDAKIEEATGGVASVDVPDEPDEPHDEPQDAEDAEPAASEPTEETADDEPTLPKRDRKWGKPVFYSGAAAIGLGLASGGGAVAFMILSDQQNDFDAIEPTDFDKRTRQVDKGLFYNELAVGLGITGGVLVVSGIVLALVGKKRMAKEESGTARIDGLSPYAGTQGRAGLVLSGRF